MSGILPRDRIATALEQMASVTGDKPNRALERIANALETMQESGGGSGGESGGANIMNVNFTFAYTGLIPQREIPGFDVICDKTFNEILQHVEDGGILNVTGTYTNSTTYEDIIQCIVPVQINGHAYSTPSTRAHYFSTIEPGVVSQTMIMLTDGNNCTLLRTNS